MATTTLPPIAIIVIRPEMRLKQPASLPERRLGERRLFFRLGGRGNSIRSAKHETGNDLQGPLMTILSKLEQRVERVCLVDRPVDYPFLPDSLFTYMALNMPRLQFIYLRCFETSQCNERNSESWIWRKSTEGLS